MDNQNTNIVKGSAAFEGVLILVLMDNQNTIYYLCINMYYSES